eukprot:COSAG01_NODE_16886_length_1196_cov_1.713765_1_plen_27_part_10
MRAGWEGGMVSLLAFDRAGWEGGMVSL